MSVNFFGSSENLLVHRDYSFSASALISIYADRIEFVSIGGLMPGIDLEDSVKEMIRAGPKKGAQNQPCQPRSFQGTSEKEEKIQAESSTVSPWVSRK